MAAVVQFQWQVHVRRMRSLVSDVAVRLHAVIVTGRLMSCKRDANRGPHVKTMTLDVGRDRRRDVTGQ